MDLEAEKSAARIAAMARRAHASPSQGAALAQQILQFCPPPPGAIVAAFRALEGEIDMFPIMHALHEQNHAICLPVTPAKGACLTFRLWHPGASFIPGRFGTFHTNGPELTPNFVLVPLLAFDHQGNRLGYGGGYYDRTLATLPNAFRLGCAFDIQEQPAIPTGPHDIKLHAVATPSGVKKFQSNI